MLRRWWCAFVLCSTVCAFALAACSSMPAARVENGDDPPPEAAGSSSGGTVPSAGGTVPSAEGTVPPAGGSRAPGAAAAGAATGPSPAPAETVPGAPTRAEPPAGIAPALLDAESATVVAPDIFRARFETSKGEFVIEVHREWAPRGADRFYNLCRIGYYDGVAFFRVLASFVVQFGLHGEPVVNAVWREQRIEDDPVLESNKRGFVAFATSSSAHSRTTQVFINLSNTNAFLDEGGYAPIGRVVEGIENVDKLFSGYGDSEPHGRGPSQGLIQVEGDEYLKREFPDLDYVRNVTLLDAD